MRRHGMATRLIDEDEACPTCGQRRHPKERPRSDFDRGRDFWAAKDAHDAEPWVAVIVVLLAFGALAYVWSIVAAWFGH
jgi:DNA-directed RNA polymerase subunit RPC12/RpoP